MADRGRLLLAALLAFVALAVAGCGSSDSGPLISAVSADNHGYRGSYLDDPYIVPDIALPDADGTLYSVATAEAPLKLVFFGYTNCPDTCQIVMSTIAGAVTRLDAAQRDQVQVVFVTTDPARDTGRALRAYLNRFNPDFVGVTGDLSRIVDLAKPMKVYIEKGQKLPSGGYEVNHATYTFGVTGDQVRLVWSEDTSPAAMAADIIKLLKS